MFSGALPKEVADRNTLPDCNFEFDKTKTNHTLRKVRISPLLRESNADLNSESNIPGGDVSLR